MLIEAKQVLAQDLAFHWCKYRDSPIWTRHAMFQDPAWAPYAEAVVAFHMNGEEALRAQHLLLTGSTQSLHHRDIQSLADRAGNATVRFVQGPARAAEPIPLQAGGTNALITDKTSTTNLAEVEEDKTGHIQGGQLLSNSLVATGNMDASGMHVFQQQIALQLPTTII